MSKTNVKKDHFTNFMLDYQPLGEVTESLQDYVKREPNYDLAFSEAWIYGVSRVEKLAQAINEDNSAFLVNFFENIHEKAVLHFNDRLDNWQNDKLKTALEQAKGKADGLNSFLLTYNKTSDVEGIEDLIDKILQKRFFPTGAYVYLNIRDEETKSKSRLWKIDHEGLFLQDSNGNKQFFDSSQAHEIKQFVIKEYEKGTLPGTGDRLLLCIAGSSEGREKYIKELFSQFINILKKYSNEENKIKTTAMIMREIMQVHPYIDGNGRAVFILANCLLLAHNFKPFYPTQMCPFDANSIDEMYREISEGQKRFSDLFGDVEKLTLNMKNYVNTIKQVEEIINKLQGVDKKQLFNALNERNLNLLLRQSATEPNCIEIFKFLYKNANMLGIDLYEKGKKSGTIKDIAEKYNNEKAVTFLKEEGYSIPKKGLSWMYLSLFGVLAGIVALFKNYSGEPLEVTALNPVKNNLNENMCINPQLRFFNSVPQPQNVEADCESKNDNVSNP